MKHRIRSFHIPFFWLLLPLVGYILLAYYAHLPLWNDPQQTYPHTPTYYRIRLTDYPIEKAKTICCNATLLHQQDSTQQWLPIQGNIKLYLQKDSLATQLTPGDIILVHTQLQQPTTKNPDDFDYTNYLRLTGFAATAYAASDSWLWLEHQKPKGIRANAIFCRNYLYQQYRKAQIHAPELGVVSALTLGYTDDLDTSTRQTFTAAGAAHILAVSGLHTAVIFAVLWTIANLLGFYPILYQQRWRREITTWIIIALLWFYAFLTGLTPSILRSVLMISIYLYGKCRYYQTNTYNILCAAAFIELLLYPLHLFTASFLLSYFAVFAILYLQPRFAQFYRPTNRIMRLLWDSVTVSIAASIGTLPLTLYFFGQASNYFILTNIIVLWLSYGVMLVAVPTLFLVAVPILGKACAWLLQKLTHYMIASSAWIENIPCSVTHLQLTTPMFIALCMMIICTCLYFRREKRVWLMVGIASLITMVGCYAYQLQKESQVEELIVLNANKETVILQRNGRTATLLTSDSTTALRTTENYRRKHYIRTTYITPLPDSTAYAFYWNNHEYLLIDAPIFEDKTILYPITTDILLVGNIGRVSAQRLLTLITPQQIVILPTCPYYKANQFATFAAQHNLPFHTTHTQAYHLKKIAINTTWRKLTHQ